MANKAQEKCLVCEGALHRTDAHPHTGKVQTGYYCQTCGLSYDVEGIPLVPVTGVIDLDPELKKADPRAAYAAVIEAIKKAPEKQHEKKDEKTRAPAVVGTVADAMKKYCRPGDAALQELFENEDEMQEETGKS